MPETEQSDHGQRTSVWEDSSWETALATRRVVRKRSPVMRQPLSHAAPKKTQIAPPRPALPKEKMEEHVVETVPVHHHSDEKAQELTDGDLLLVRSALHADSPRLTLSAVSVGAYCNTPLLLSFALLFTTFFLLEGALFASSSAYTRMTTASSFVPLTLPVRDGLSDAQMHAFLALLVQMQEVRHVRYVTKEQATALLAERYPEQAPFLGAGTIGDTAELTLRSGVESATLLSTFSRPAFSSILEPSFLLHMEEWEQAVTQETSFWRTASFAFVTVAALSFFLLSLTYRMVRRMDERMRMEEMRVLTLLGADHRTFFGRLPPVHLLLTLSFVASLVSLSALLFLF